MKNTFFKILPLFSVVCGLSGCLKEGPMNIDASKTISVVEFANTGDNMASASSSFPRFYTDLGSIGNGESASFNVNVNYAGGTTASEDITVNLAIDEAALAEYNTQDGTHYEVPPASVFSFPSSVVIKQGTKLTQIEAEITRTADFDFSKSYALPIKISSVSKGEVSKGFGTAVYSFGVRNQYDGVYTMKGWILREGDNVLSGNFTGVSRSLTTTGANSNGFAQVWSNASAVGGIDGLTLTVDPATNKVKVSSINPALVNAPGYDSRYDPDTKTFYVSFYWGTGPTNRAATDTLTYVGPR